MLPKIYRLTRQELNLIKSSGRKVSSGCFLATTKPFATKFAVVISSSVSKKAVVRNRLRRKIYDLIPLNLLKDRGVVISAAPRVVNLNSEELKFEIDSLVSKILS